MLESDPEKPLQNSLHRRHDQLLRWQQSDFFHEPSKFKEANKVVFPLGTQFLAACSSGDIEEAGRLLRKGVDVNTANVDGLTALHQACIDNDLELVEFLIEHGCDVDVKDNEGWTPLHATASCAYTEVAKYLLSKGADLAAVNNDGDLSVDLADNQEMEALLHDEMCRRGIDAVKARSVEQQKMLKDAQRWQKTGRYVEVLDPKSGASPLHVAAAKGYMEVIQLLLQCPNVSINARDYDGWTPLHAAAHWGQERACETLVENNADMDLVTNAAQDIFEIAEPDLTEVLRALKNKQASRRQAASSEITDALPRKEGTGKRRSSVTRMSVDQKASVTSKIAEQEGIPTVQPDSDISTGGAGDSTGLKMPSPVNEEPPEIRPWAKRRQQIEAAAESDFRALLGRKEKPEIPTVEEEPHEQVKEKSPTPPPRSSPAKVTEEVPEKVVPAAEDEEKTKEPEKKEVESKPDEEEPRNETTPSVPQDLGKENGVEPPMTGPPPSQLNQRRVSAVMAPMKGDESETQRSARARHARATRRSTQGVSEDELQEAKKLLQTGATTGPTQTTATTTVAASPADSTTTTTSASDGISAFAKAPSPADAVGERNGTSSIDQRYSSHKESPAVNDSSVDPVTGLPTVRSRRHQRRHQLATSNLDTESKDSSQSSPGVTTTPSAPSPDQKTVDDVKTSTTTTTSRSTVAPSTSGSATSSHSTRSTRPLSSITSTSSITSPGERSSPPSSTWRPRSAISSVGSGYGSSLTRTPTFHGTTASSAASPTSSDRHVDVTTDSSKSASGVGTAGDDDWKTRRRARRERPPTGKSPTDTTQSSISDKGASGSKTESGRYSLLGDSTDNVRQSSSLRPNSYHDSSSPRPFTSRWGSNTSAISDSGPIDYKKLYEQERLESERLRKELDMVKRDLTDSRNDAERLRKQQGSSSVDTRRLERKLSEYEEEIKMIDQLKQENAKMKEENGALIRVISKLSK